MRYLASYLFVTLSMLAGLQPAVAQDLENGRRVSERACTECHVIAPGLGRPGRARPFAAIAAKPSVSAEMIAAFLMLPHATMPNLQLSRDDARDVAAFILEKK